MKFLPLFAHEREVIERQGTLHFNADFIEPLPGEVPQNYVGSLTIGDITVQEPSPQKAKELSDVIDEIAASRTGKRYQSDEDDLGKQQWKIVKRYLPSLNW